MSNTCSQIHAIGLPKYIDYFREPSPCAFLTTIPVVLPDYLSATQILRWFAWLQRVPPHPSNLRPIVAAESSVPSSPLAFLPVCFHDFTYADTLSTSDLRACMQQLQQSQI